MLQYDRLCTFLEFTLKVGQMRTFFLTFLHWRSSSNRVFTSLPQWAYLLWEAQNKAVHFRT